MTKSTKRDPIVDIPLADDFGSTEYLSDYATEAISQNAAGSSTE